MRNLNLGDAFYLARIIKRLNLKEELKAVYKNITEESSKEEIGMDLIYTLFEKATEEQSEKELYNFLSRPFEINLEEVEKMDLLKVVKDFSNLSDLEGWKSFLKQAVKLK